MTLLIIYVLFALVFSFLCSIAEAVILSVTPAYIALLEEEKSPSGPLLRTLKADVNKPRAAILTLNTIAHTVGAAGAQVVRRGFRSEAGWGSEADSPAHFAPWGC